MISPLKNILQYLRKISLRISKMLSRRKLRRFLTCEFLKIPRGSHVLSVGSGGEVGEMLHRISRDKFEVTEIDIDPERKPDIVADICETNFENSFDFIVVVEVLEHVVAPFDAVENLRISLKEGGRLIGSTPFIFPLHDEPHDHFRYSRHQLQDMFCLFENFEIFEKTGFFETICVLISRSALSDNLKLSFLSLPINIAVLFLWPIALVLDKVFPTRFAPLGYLFVASKDKGDGHDQISPL